MYFDESLSKDYGVNAAIILQHIAFWVSKNRQNNKNFIDGKYWTYQTLNELLEKFNFLSIDKIRYAIEKLIKAKIIVKNRHSKNRYDRTNWYAFEDENLLSELISKYEKNSQMDGGEIPKGRGKKTRSLTDDKTDIKTDDTEVVDCLDRGERENIKLELISNNISEKQAEKILNSNQISYIRDKIEQFNYILNHNPQSIKKKSSYLYMSIKDNWIDDIYEAKKRGSKKSTNRSTYQERDKKEYDDYVKKECLREYRALSNEQKEEIDRKIVGALGNHHLFKSNSLLFDIELQERRVGEVFRRLDEKLISFEKFMESRRDCFFSPTKK